MKEFKGEVLTMKKIIVLLMVALFGAVIFADAPRKLDLGANQEIFNRNLSLDFAAYINYLNYVYYIVETYNDSLVLAEEYEKLSIKKINLPALPKLQGDEGQNMLTAIQNLSDELYKLKLSEDEYKEIQRQLENQKRLERKKMVYKMLSAENVKKVAKDTAAGVVKGAKLSKNVAGAITGAAFGIVKGASGPYREYDLIMEDLQERRERAEFELNKAKKAAAKKASDELMKAETRFIKALDMKEADIVNPDEMEKLTKTLKGPDRNAMFNVLKSDHTQKLYHNFAPYWCYLASLAVTVDKPNYNIAVHAATEYENVHRNIQKNDPMTADVLIAKVTAMVNLESTNTVEIARCLNKIEDLNEMHLNPDWSYFCASVWFSYLKDNNKAIDTITTSISALNIAYSSRLVEYRNLYKKGESDFETKKNKMPLDASLLRARVLLRNIIEDSKEYDFKESLEEICRSSTISALEKLYYCGKVRPDDLWGIAEKEVLEISLNYQEMLTGNEFYLYVPISWFMLGEVKSELQLIKDGKTVRALHEARNKRRVMRSQKEDGPDLVRLRFACKKKDLVGVDSVRLKFPHESWPVEITYKPSLGFDLENITQSKNYTPVMIDFMGVKKDLVSPDQNIKKLILDNGMPNHSRRLIPFVYGKLNISTNFLSSLTIDKFRNLTVAYTNPTPQTTSIEMRVGYYSRYGARICEVTGKETIQKSSSGEWNLPWPETMNGSEKPCFVLFQYHIDQDVWDKLHNKYYDWTK